MGGALKELYAWVIADGRSSEAILARRCSLLATVPVDRPASVLMLGDSRESIEQYRREAEAAAERSQCRLTAARFVRVDNDAPPSAGDLVKGHLVIGVAEGGEEVLVEFRTDVAGKIILSPAQARGLAASLNRKAAEIEVERENRFRAETNFPGGER